MRWQSSAPLARFPQTGSQMGALQGTYGAHLEIVLPLPSWNFIGQDPGQFRHYGPAAQDFFAAFGNDGIGTIGTPTTITSTDIDGILMVAVQALERRMEENDALKARVEALERMLGSEVAGR